MTKNRLLNVAIVFTRILRISYVLSFIALIGFFIHFQAYPETYKNFELVKNEKGIEYNVTLDDLTFTNKPVLSGEKSNVEVFKNKESVFLENITIESLFFNFLRFTFILIFSFFAIREFENVMQSVKEINTFRNQNITSFKKIGKYFFVIFILSSYSYYSFEIGEHIDSHSTMELSFTPLILMIFALVIAEVFKEGYQLMEENRLTI